jgi:hypothetical protein
MPSLAMWGCSDYKRSGGSLARVAGGRRAFLGFREWCHGAEKDYAERAEWPREWKWRGRAVRLGK